MKLLRITSGVMTLSLASLLACNKTIEQPEETVGQEPKVTVTATVVLPEESTSKLAYDENDAEGMASGLKSTWETGDQFYALKDGSEIVQFTLASGEGTTTGVFTTEASGVSEGTSWKALLGKNAAPSSGKLACTYSVQTGTLAHLGDVDYTVMDGTGTDPSFDFDEGQRLSYFMRIKLPAGVRYIEYCTTASWKVSSSGASIVYDGHFDNVSEIDLGHESSAGEVCYLAIPATQYANYINEQQKGVILTYMSADRKKSNGNVLNSNLSEKGGKIGTFNVSGITLIDRPLPDEAVSLGSRSLVIRKDHDPDFCNKYNNLGDYRYNTAVDPAWAPYNLGARITAASPTADDLYGDYFMWGEISPRTGSYTSSTWTYDGNHTVGGLENFPSTQLGYFQTVSVSDGSSNGTMKFQRISGTKFDAARVRWGHDWRMPTIEELVSLMGDSDDVDIADAETVTPSGLTTKLEVIDFYGVGRTVKGRWFSNGTATVFFPFAGWYGQAGTNSYAGNARNYHGARAFYRSDSRIRATPSNGSLTNATLYMEMNGGALNYGRNSGPTPQMYYGTPIRPVRNIKASGGNATSPSIWEDVGESTISPTSNLWGVIKDNSGNPIPGVAVSDGYNVCVTDVNGTYQMQADSRARTVNVTVPAAYEIPMENGRPAFYQYVTIPSTGAVQKDFTLTKRSSIPSRFTILAVTDEHIQKSAHVTKFQTAVDDMQETATTLATSGIPVGDGGNAGEVIAISLGDQMWDNMSMGSSIVSTFTGRLNVPVFYTIGNHDYDAAQASDYDAETAFVNTFGPTDYSFDIGNAHIIVMDDIVRRNGNGSGTAGYSTVNYGEGFTSEQVDWLRADIARVKGAASKLVILCVHAPLSSASGGDTDTQSAVMSALKNNFYNVHVFSGHTHVLKNNYYGGWAAKSGRHIHEHTIQTLSGYFWEADISYHNASPAGYGVYTFASDDLYAEYNKTTKEDPTFQFWVYNGGETYIRRSPSYKTYTWDSPVKSKFIAKLPDACDTDADGESWTFTLSSGGTSETMTRVSDPINDKATHCYISGNLDNNYSYGGGDGDLDVFWYSSRNFSSGSFTITATHTMPSGWSATYTRTHYVNGSTWKGFAYGVRFE